MKLRMKLRIIKAEHIDKADDLCHFFNYQLYLHNKTDRPVYETAILILSYAIFMGISSILRIIQ